ncbi:MAG TPA: hypothetical protein VNT01_01425, partial [Symbiobacteriaceae bacterium]|nr:hypothetical protein [Symbiobacteriaceae bacterium]
MRINTNMSAMNAWRNLTVNNSNLQKSLEKLSSGYRINKAADDAAGLAVSEKMRAQIRGLNQATRNAQDGIALVQTAEGGAGQIQNMLQRMRELTVQASSGALQDADRSQLDTEYQQLLGEIDRTASSISYNKINLLSGSTGTPGTSKTGMTSNAAVGTLNVGGTATAGANYVIKVNTLADNARATASGTLAATAGTGAANDSGYVLKINGTSVYSAAAGQQVDKAQIAAAINSNATVNTNVKASYDSTSGVLTVESMNTGAGQSFTIDETYADGSTAIASDAEGFFATSSGTVTKSGVDASVTVTPTSTGVAATTSAASNTAFAIGTGVTMDLKSVGTTTATVNSSSTSSSTDLDVDLQIGANDGDNLRITLKRLTA